MVFSDRGRRMLAALPPELPVTFTSEWRGPFDGRELSVDLLHTIGYRLVPRLIPSDNPWWNRQPRLGEMGCALSHHARRPDASNSVSHTSWWSKTT